MPLEDLQYFQGNLKTLDQPQFDKLKRSILKHGFSFPVFVWNDQIIDGHQRIFVTRHLVEQEGYTIDGDIPVVEIQAKDHNEAAEKLLLMTSRYGEVTDAGGFITVAAKQR
jgi:ParB-like chromosome segregation protein Spo0J